MPWLVVRLPAPVSASHRCTGCARPVVARQHEAGSAADMREYLEGRAGQGHQTCGAGVVNR